MAVAVPGAAVSVPGAAVSLQEVTTQGTASRERRSNARFIIFLIVVCL